MPAKKKPSMREIQARKMMMQKIAKGGPQMSGVKKPAAPAKPAAKPSGGRPALPPGRRGGALVRQGNAKPENPRRTSARSRQATASRGTTGPGRVGQPAGSANRMYGANVVNRSVGRAIASTRLAGLSKAAGRLAIPAGIATQAMDVAGGFQKLANHPFIQKMGKGGKPAPSASRRTNPKAAKPTKPKPNMDRPGLRYEKMTDTQAPRSAYGLKDKPTPGTTRASTPSRSTAPARTPSRSSAPARPAASASRPTAAPSRATSSAPKPPAASSAPKPPKMPAAKSSFGPVKSGEEYGRMIGAPKAPSSSSAPATKKKSSALSQAEIRKRRVNR